MQAIYELTFSTPPPLKRGMVIVWDCVHCKTQNAIREAACMHCSAAQVHRYHYVALCTHYKALEGRRQKRLAELEGGDGALLATAPPATATAVAAASSSSSATPSAMRQPRERDSARSGRASSGGARQSAAKQPPSSSSAAAVDEAGATPVTSRSRRGGGRVEPRKPRIPIISQYPHKAPKIGPDHQVDVDALPNPAQFVKTALDYTVYFDRLPLPPDAVDELSPWEYNNAYYDVLWMARDQFVHRSQPCAMAQCPIAAERGASLSQATPPPPPPPQRLLVAPSSASLALAAVATTTAAAAAEAAVDEAAGVAAPVAVHSDAMDVDGSAIDDDVAVTVASADGVAAAAEAAGSAAAVVAAVVADVVDEAATAAATAASATVGSGHQRASRVAEAPSTSFTVVAQRVQPSDAAVSDADASENLLRGLDNATLSTLYPVLALRQLYQHRYELDAVHASFAQTVLRHHRHTAIVFRDRPCRPLVPDAVEDAAAAAAEAAAEAAAPTDAAAAALSSPVPPSQPPQLPPVAAPAIDAQATPTATATATVQRLHRGPLDLPLLELSAVDRARFQQALIRHGNDEWNAVARELRGDYTVGQLQDFYYGSWTTRYRALAQETDRLQRNFKRSAAGKRPRRTSHTSRELSNLLLDQERSNFLAEFGGRVSSKNRDRRQRASAASSAPRSPVWTWRGVTRRGLAHSKLVPVDVPRDVRGQDPP
eukprot:gene358-234_t